MSKVIFTVILKVIVKVIDIFIVTLSMQARSKRAWWALWMQGRHVAATVTVTVTEMVISWEFYVKSHIHSHFKGHF